MGKPKGHYITVESESLEYIKKEHQKNIKKRNYKIIKAEQERQEENGTEVFYFEYEVR